METAELLDRIEAHECMDEHEKEEWLRLVPVMSEHYKQRLGNILEDEEIKLAESQGIYEEEERALAIKHAKELERIKQPRVIHDDPRTVPMMEKKMSEALGYRVWIQEILLAPRNDAERGWRKECMSLIVKRNLARNRSRV